MNKIIISTFLSLSLLFSFQLQAQDAPTFKAFKKIWKQLSAEEQAKVMSFAQKQVDGGEVTMPAPEPEQQIAVAQPATPVVVNTNGSSFGGSNSAFGESSSATISLNTEVEEAPATTSVEWGGEVHNFGLISQGDVVKHTFEFSNSGEAPLTISNVKPSCGCTTPSYSKKAIAPGEKGFVEVAFNSKGKMGMQNKSVVVYMNTDRGTTVLRFKGEIVSPDAAPNN